MTAQYTEEQNGYTIEIYQDEINQNPRHEWDHFGHMVCWNRQYDLGDKYNPFEQPADALEYFKTHGSLVLPLFLLDHSGLAMHYGRFECDAAGWDTSKVGWIYVDPEEIRKAFECKYITKKIREKAFELLRSEVKEFSAYLEGDCWGYVVKGPGGEESCWGFLGDYNSCLEDARSVAQVMFDEQMERCA